MRIHGDQVESHDKGMALLFWVFAAACVGGSLFVVTRRNLIAAVMGMVGHEIVLGHPKTREAMRAGTLRLG